MKKPDLDSLPRLLWPKNIRPEDKSFYQLPEETIDNLGLDKIIDLLCYEEEDHEFIEDHFINLCRDEEVIDFRLSIMQDFLKYKELLEVFEEILPLIEKIEDYGHHRDKRRDNTIGWRFRNIAFRLEMLGSYFKVVQKLHNTLKKYKEDIRSDGLKEMYNYLHSIIESEEYNTLREKLPEFREEIKDIRSVTIGINLDPTLKLQEAIFLEADRHPHKKDSIITRLFNLKNNEEKIYGSSQFHSFRPDKEELEKTLFTDLKEVFSRTLAPIDSVLSTFGRLEAKFLVDIKREIHFYIQAVKLTEFLQSSGVNMCRPKVLSSNERTCKIQELVELNLTFGLLEEIAEEMALEEEENMESIFSKKRSYLEEKREKITLKTIVEDQEELDEDITDKIVSNDVRFDEKGRIFILTGPNQGGKTTFTRAIGLAQILFQAGLFIPAKKAAMSPVDIVHSHFTESEEINIKDGRLGEESRRLARIFRTITPHSLLLLNESLSSTSPGESLYLLTDIVKALKLLGCRVVLNTHLHDLALQIDEINSSLDGKSKLVSLVAEVEKTKEGPNKRTYKIKRKPPEAKSYALDIAEKYGITFTTLEEKVVNVLKDFPEIK